MPPPSCRMDGPRNVQLQVVHAVVDADARRHLEPTPVVPRLAGAGHVAMAVLLGELPPVQHRVVAGLVGPSLAVLPGNPVAATPPPREPCLLRERLIRGCILHCLWTRRRHLHPRGRDRQPRLVQTLSERHSALDAMNRFAGLAVYRGRRAELLRRWPIESGVHIRPHLNGALAGHTPRRQGGGVCGGEEDCDGSRRPAPCGVVEREETRAAAADLDVGGHEPQQQPQDLQRRFATPRLVGRPRESCVAALVQLPRMLRPLRRFEQLSNCGPAFRLDALNEHRRERRLDHVDMHVVIHEVFQRPSAHLGLEQHQAPRQTNPCRTTHRRRQSLQVLMEHIAGHHGLRPPPGRRREHDAHHAAAAAGGRHGAPRDGI
mmetsp:Transcript_133232/g.385565  ORF Transcript_133232/g.385565 Transcript_133232/m.385565 type:complete len:375 (-) Transcript_133232:23-1147(-)